MKIGSTTGFFRNMVDILLEDAKKQGFVPDTSVAGMSIYYAQAKLQRAASQIDEI